MTTLDTCRGSTQRASRRGLFLGFALALIVGCGSTQVTNRQAYQGGPLPRPARIIVYDFAATPADLPAWSEASQRYGQAEAPMSADDLEEGRKLGADVAEKLVAKINDTGMTAVRAEGQPAPEHDDIALVGYFTTIDQGSAVERVVIGFGTGAASVGAHAEGYRMTERGLVLLGSGDVASGGGKSPGLVVPTLVTIATANPIGLAVGGAVKAASAVSGHSGAKGAAQHIADEIAQVLESRFREEGWI